MPTKIYTIPNISCGHCVNTIQNELADLDGVQKVVANQVTKQATVTFEPPATEEKIQNLLAEINYPVTA